MTLATLTKDLQALPNSDLRVVADHGKPEAAEVARTELAVRAVRRDQQQRIELAIEVDQAAAALGNVLNHWYTENLPGDFSTPETGYPFDLSLDEQVAEVAAWAEKLREQANEDIWRCTHCGHVFAERVYDPVGYSDGATCPAPVEDSDYPCEHQAEWIGNVPGYENEQYRNPDADDGLTAVPS